MRKIFLLVLVIIFAELLPSGNPFFKEKKSTNIPLITQNSFFTQSKIFRKIVKIQRDLNEKLVELSKKAKEDPQKVFLLLFFAFIYGVIHAVGPGHGKVFSVFYFMSENISIREGVILSSLVGIVHGMVGIALVLVLKYVLSIYSFAFQQDVSVIIQRVSYLMIAGIGGYIFIRRLVGKREHTHNHKDGYALAFSVALVPCPGVVLIMLFAISSGVLPLGLAMSFAMSVGMAVTIVLFGLSTIFIKNKLLDNRNSVIFTQIRYFLGLFFAFCLFGYGLVLYISI